MRPPQNAPLNLSPDDIQLATKLARYYFYFESNSAQFRQRFRVDDHTQAAYAHALQDWTTRPDLSPSSYLPTSDTALREEWWARIDSILRSPSVSAKDFVIKAFAASYGFQAIRDNEIEDTPRKPAILALAAEKNLLSAKDFGRAGFPPAIATLIGKKLRRRDVDGKVFDFIIVSYGFNADNGTWFKYLPVPGQEYAVVAIDVMERWVENAEFLD